MSAEVSPEGSVEQLRRELSAWQKAVGELDDQDARHVYGLVDAALAKTHTTSAELLRDVYSAAGHVNVPEGTCIGTSEQFVGLAIGWANNQHLLLPDEADGVASLLQRAAAKVRAGQGGKP